MLCSDGGGQSKRKQLMWVEQGTTDKLFFKSADTDKHR